MEPETLNKLLADVNATSLAIYTVSGIVKGTKI